MAEVPMARDEELDAELERRGMPRGGEVVTGAMAERALDAVGARAMTLDRTILVREDFDADAPEDQALYAHELVHAQMSGGMGPHAGDHDAEETLAREVERRVFHRRRKGEAFEEVLEDAEDATRTGPSPEPDDDRHDPMAAYRALRRQGLEHEEIVRTMARDIAHTIRDRQNQLAQRGGRSGDHSPFG